MIQSIIGQDIEFEGKLKTTSMLRIDGSFSGEIIGKGNLFIGETGKVEASIEIVDVTIGGVFSGHIRSKGKIRILSSSSLSGHMESQSLEIEEGAKLDVQISTKKKTDIN